MITLPLKSLTKIFAASVYVTVVAVCQIDCVIVKPNVDDMILVSSIVMTALSQ